MCAISISVLYFQMVNIYFTYILVYDYLFIYINKFYIGYFINIIQTELQIALRSLRSSEVLKITFYSNFFNKIDQEKKSITFYGSTKV